ncbi:hypothetical protein BJY04DRAFT_193157 [Aspergillus karnatakaensis]|uniref:uncharacterized protein n=1 Tax=Aspergillus karnatakaensis TaxID=1810916 RepID=UPI003CCE4A50
MEHASLFFFHHVPLLVPSSSTTNTISQAVTSPIHRLHSSPKEHPFLTISLRARHRFESLSPVRRTGHPIQHNNASSPSKMSTSDRW